MKLRKFFGLTSRSVLEQVRAELGADAVIVANHATAEGIEVTALAGNAIDTLLAPQAAAVPEREPAPPPDAPSPAPATSAPVAAAASEPPPPIDADLAPRMMAEMTAMRGFIEDKLAELAWSDALRRRPLATRLVRDLLAAGYSPALARTVTQRLPDDMNASQAREWMACVLARNLRCVDTADEIVTRGGIYALVGPTGVGKTTTTAKLAARCAVRYGAHSLALVSTDGFRIGAQDQLRIYARILGVAVHSVCDRHDLAQALDALRGRHLVLIDTVGLGQRDARVADQAMLLAQREIRRLLLLNAAAQGETLDEVVEAYARAPAPSGSEATPLAGCIVTKQDEASRLGGALDVAIRHRLPLHYVTTGQQVPEDVYVPTSELVVKRSLRMGARASAFALAADDLPLALVGAKAAHA